MTAAVLASHEGIYGIQAAVSSLCNGATALDSLEEGIKLVEDAHDARTVGFGGAPNLLGEMECDAAVMDGATRMSGAVAAIRGCRYPVSAARKVMERLPHVMLSGAGASRFAREMHLPEHSLLSDQAKTDYERWRHDNIPPQRSGTWREEDLVPLVSFQTRSDLSKGTVTFLVRDKSGYMCAGTSTSGWAYKYPGRLGDSPLVGAGLYVDQRYGGATCTHTGEMTIRCTSARTIVLLMQKGATVQEACLEAIADLRSLKTGYLGPVIVHAMSCAGETAVFSTGGDDGDFYCFWQEGMAAPQQLQTPIAH